MFGLWTAKIDNVETVDNVWTADSKLAEDKTVDSKLVDFDKEEEQEERRRLKIGSQGREED